MRVIFPFTTPHPLADAALRLHAPGAELYKLDGNEHAYYWLLRQCWEQGDRFIVVEQDIEVLANTIGDLKTCTEPWCIVPYGGAGNPKEGDHFLYNALGCTKFDSELLMAQPSLLIEKVQPVTWRLLDSHINAALRSVLSEPHLHYPPVLHHHVYQGRCACGTAHAPYEVDADGRYKEGN